MSMNKMRASFIWFGAAISIAEIMTGTYFGGLTWTEGFMAILLGHIIGGILMYGAGMIGGLEKIPAMETVQLSFGDQGGKIFGLINVAQLVGWTAIMIYDGALMAQQIIPFSMWSEGSTSPLWSIILGVLLLLWIIVGQGKLLRLNQLAGALLFLLSIMLGWMIFAGASVASVGPHESVLPPISFSLAVELAAVMPISWLPLIADYTKDSNNPRGVTLASVCTYGFASIGMYILGMGAAKFTGGGDIGLIMVKAGLSIGGLLIILFSTVTTGYLDVYSAGISGHVVKPNWGSKNISIATVLIATVGAALYPMDNIMDFLLLIGSVFAPMIAIQLVHYFYVVHHLHIREREPFHGLNILLWCIGFGVYRYLLQVEFPWGTTLPAIALIMVVALAVYVIKYRSVSCHIEN